MPPLMAPHTSPWPPIPAPNPVAIFGIKSLLTLKQSLIASRTDSEHKNPFAAQKSDSFMTSSLVVKLTTVDAFDYLRIKSYTHGNRELLRTYIVLEKFELRMVTCIFVCAFLSSVSVVALASTFSIQFLFLFYIG